MSWWSRLYVYFAQHGSGNLIKIGISSKPLFRVTDMWAPDAAVRGCRLLGTIPIDRQGQPFELYTTYAPERELHQRFADGRVIGEWFEPTPDLLAFIDSLTTEAIAA